MPATRQWPLPSQPWSGVETGNGGWTPVTGTPPGGGTTRPARRSAFRTGHWWCCAEPSPTGHKTWGHGFSARRSRVTSALAWVGFNLGVLVVLVIDLGLTGQKGRPLSQREATRWVLLWATLSMALCALLWRTRGSEAGLQ